MGRKSEKHVYLLNLREQVLKDSWRHAAILIRLLIKMFHVSKHGMRLAAARLYKIKAVKSLKSTQENAAV